MIDYEKQSIFLLSEYKKTSNNEYLQKLYNLHKGLFYKISMKYAAFMDIEDLQQECFFALIKAVEGFQEEQGSFTKYLAKVTQSHLYRITQSNTSFLPEYMAALINKYNDIMADLAKKGAALTDKQLAYKLEISENTLNLLYKALSVKTSISLNTPIDEEGATLEDLTPDDYDLEGSCINELFTDEVKERVHECISSLSVTDQELIIKRYIEELPLTEIDLARSPERNRQRVNAAFRRLQKIGKIKLAYMHEEYIYNRALKSNGVGNYKRTWTSSTEKIILQMEQRAT